MVLGIEDVTIFMAAVVMQFLYDLIPSSFWVLYASSLM